MTDLSGASVLVVHGGGHIDLAITRSLGRAGAKVIVGSPMGMGSARYSRYAAGILEFSSRDLRQVAQECLEFVQREAVTHIITPEESLIVHLNALRGEIEKHAILLFPDREAFAECLHKDRTLERAERLGIPAPRTHVPKSLDDLEPCRAWVYPVVFKPNHRDPRLRHPGAQDYIAAYASSYDDLCAQVGALGPHADPPMIQEFAAGEGVGIEVLMRQGEPLFLFQHRRLREKPATGGISVLCESETLCPALADYAVRLLRDMNWDGVAMVEFRQDPATGAAMLLEVNGRFWGSLPLAIQAGADFPAELLRSRMDPTYRPRQFYRIGTRCRSLAHDTSALVEILRTGCRPRLAAVCKYLAGFAPTVGGYVWSADDPAPGLLHPWQRMSRIGSKPVPTSFTRKVNS
ncbi:MAG: ATP-grasp domain-containing protein [Bryobacteraceae bacterium]|nr:ATP-grasp domain-containing protein [Bryobacteraceae bacterium]